jgi:hypothetical protein
MNMTVRLVNTGLNSCWTGNEALRILASGPPATCEASVHIGREAHN